jgi:hypothetical protein
VARAAFAVIADNAIKEVASKSRIFFLNLDRSVKAIANFFVACPFFFSWRNVTLTESTHSHTSLSEKLWKTLERS